MQTTTIKILFSTIAFATLAACGGGGDGETAINLSPLVGTDTQVVGTFTNSCGGNGTESATAVSSVSSDTMTLTITARGEALNYTLKYISGDNTNGYVFSGNVKNITAGGGAQVLNATFRNLDTTGQLNLVGSVTAIEGNCTVTQNFK